MKSNLNHSRLEINILSLNFVWLSHKSWEVLDFLFVTAITDNRHKNKTCKVCAFNELGTTEKD